MDAVLAAARGQQLHADADAEEGLALAVHRLVQPRDQPRLGPERADALRERADAGQHDAVRRRDVGRLAADHDTRRARRLQRLRGGTQVARAIVDDQRRALRHY